MNRGVTGARGINQTLQNALNPPGEHRVEKFGYAFSGGDKVMQIENNYDAMSVQSSTSSGTAPCARGSPISREGGYPLFFSADYRRTADQGAGAD